jgi:hypothetical protein
MVCLEKGMVQFLGGLGNSTNSCDANLMGGSCPTLPRIKFSMSGKSASRGISPALAGATNHRIGAGSRVTWSQKGAFSRFCGDFACPRMYSASTKGIAHTEKTAGIRSLDTLMIISAQPKAVAIFVPLCAIS